MMAWTVRIFGHFQRTAEFLAGSAPVRKFPVFPHGKTSFTDRISLGKKFRVFRIAFVEWYDAFSVKEFLDLIVNTFHVVSFVSKKGAFRNRKESMGVGKDTEGDCGICYLSGCGYFINGETGNTVYEDMVFVAPVELIFLFISLVGSSVYAELTVLIGFGLAVRLKFAGKERFGIVL